ncbi:hypothetical protein SBOR_8553 [Sclerotinia borealis F-4128]|uniref:Rhodopsin domain-containing protein n=1 Tax=Sclerotinia borealis (strain F-4128) TaxID=1432307 RepID=W9C869_SCLBF|nr:hypothetical protein SBOR_8553 [Sclerotinia borealis F-4128]
MSFLGVEPGLVPQYVGYQMQTTVIAFMVLGIVFVSLRLFARYVSGSRMGIDDILILPAIVCYLGQRVTGLLMVRRGGIGYHAIWLKTYHPLALQTFAKLQIVMVILYSASVTFPKLSMLGLYLRIFVGKRERIAAYTTMGIVSASFIALILCALLQCAPLGYLWNKAGHPGGHCFNTGVFWRYGSLPNLITDLAMLVLPLPCIWKLKLSQRDKIGLVFTFITGSIGIITAIVRIAFFWNIDGQTDVTWAAVRLGEITIAEPGVYLIAACLPTYRSLFRFFKERTGLTTKGSTQNTWGSKKDTSGMELPSRHTVKSAADGFEELSDEDLISRRISKNKNSTHVQATDYGYKKDPKHRNSNREIRVQREVRVDSVLR